MNSDSKPFVSLPKKNKGNQGSRGVTSTKRLDHHNDISLDSQEKRYELQQPITQNDVSRACQVVLDFHHEQKELGRTGVVEPKNDRDGTFAHFRKAKPHTYDGKYNL